MEPPSQAELLARTRRAHDSLRHWQLVLGTTHRPYANLLLLCLTLPEPVAPLQPQRLLGIVDSAAALLACLPEDGSDVLVALEDTLRDGSVLPLLLQLRQRPSPPVVLLTLDAPAAQAAWVQAAWRTGVEALVLADHFGQGVLAEALQALERGERYCDPGIRALLTPAGPAADGLSRRELEVLPLLAEGLTNRQIAARLQIVEVTARDTCSASCRSSRCPIVPRRRPGRCAWGWCAEGAGRRQDPSSAGCAGPGAAQRLKPDTGAVLQEWLHDQQRPQRQPQHPDRGRLLSGVGDLRARRADRRCAGRSAHPPDLCLRSD